MAQKLDVVNLALSALTQNPVTDLSQASLNSSNGARKVLAQLDQARDSILERHGWLRAMNRIQLNPGVVPNYSDFKYPNAYKLPGDCLSIRSVRVAWPPATAAAPPLPPGPPNPTPTTASPWDCGPEGWGWGDPFCATPEWELGTVDTDGDEVAGTGTDAMATTIIRAKISTTLNVEYIRRLGWASMSPLLSDAIGYEAARRAGRSVISNAGVLGQVEKDAGNSLALAMGAEATQEGAKPPLVLSTFRALRNSTM